MPTSGERYNHCRLALTGHVPADEGVRAYPRSFATPGEALDLWSPTWLRLGTLLQVGMRFDPGNFDGTLEWLGPLSDIETIAGTVDPLLALVPRRNRHILVRPELISGYQRYSGSLYVATWRFNPDRVLVRDRNPTSTHRGWER